MTVSPVWPGLIEAYRSRLPVSDSTPVVTLQEGATPLLPAQELSQRTGCEVYLKVEGANPTGSFKDRGMTMAISRAVEEGSKAVICASTGNTSASAAAYAARAGITCAVLVPQGKIAMGNQYRIEGQKTAAFEIVDVLGDAPDIHCLPVGNAGNITAYWQGYREYAADGIATRTPQMWGFQAAGAAPIVSGQVVENPTTIATAIRIGNPASWTKALDARDQSGGRIDAVTDRAILAAYRLLARSEAVFVEPASAASVAGLLQVAAAGELPAGSRVVCTVTGNGLKDPEWAISGAPAPVTIPVDAAAAAAQLGL
jgi:threonine synthase